MTTLATYIPEQVTCLVAGMLKVQGFIDGKFIEISKDVQPYKSVRTPDGTIARLYDKDSSYTISITIYSGSSSNDFLTKLWQLDEITQAAKFPLLIKDNSGTDLFFSATTWITDIPAIVKSNEFESRTWILKSSQATINVGSNETASGLITDLTNMATSVMPSLNGIFSNG
jgi:hypothetical protein